MQVATTVKTTIQEVKKALRLLNPNLPTEFVLDIDIDIECNAEVDKVSSVEPATPWYPDNSGEWVETYREKPQNVKEQDLIEVIHYAERDAKVYRAKIYRALGWCNDWDLSVAYKPIKKGN